MIAGIPHRLFPEEETFIANAVAHRKAEFSVGRYCARNALRKLGHDDVAIPAGADRAPLWPEGIVGSISHSRTHCAAAVASRADGYRAIGIDIEDDEALDMSYAADILVSREKAWLDAQAASQRGLLLKAFFCAKEAAYKCQYAVSARIIGFDGLGVELQIDTGRFRAAFRMDVGPFHAGDALEGRILFTDGHVAAAVTMT